MPVPYCIGKVVSCVMVTTLKMYKSYHLLKKINSVTWMVAS